MKLNFMMVVRPVSVAVRPISIFIVLAIAVVAPSVVIIPWWCKVTRHAEDTLNLENANLHFALKLGVDNIAKSLHYSNSSAIYLATNVNILSLKTSTISFSEIETKVAPLLFQAISTIPKISQVSYIGINGVFYSYYNHNNQTFALYSSNPNIWYAQQVNPLTGKPYGNITQSQPFIYSNATWIQQALHRDNGFASLETDWTGSSQQLLLLNTVSVSGGNAVVSLGFRIGGLMEVFDGVHFNGGSLYLGSIDGKILLQGIDSTSVEVINGDFVSISTKMDNAEIREAGKVSCVDFKIRNSILNFGDRSYNFYCSKLQIAGLESVSVLAFPQDKLVSFLHKENKTALILLVVITVAMAIYVLTFVVLMVKAAKREMKLCSALIKQMEATQQAERKSMNKSLAFANSSHDIRVLVAGITGLIDISYLQVPSASELANNLKLMETCTKDLLDLLNSILDMSKIEDGKMQLEENEFDVAKLVEDVVDLSHLIAARKGVDVMLDCGDASINKFARVKGDRGKLRQILSNLLSNAVKFTSEGHVLVRVLVKKPEENKIMSGNQNSWLRFLTLLFSKKNKEEFRLDRQIPNTMNYTFEVEDTGKGIPKEKWKSVFENYVQVKETANGQGGTGLGLGIVQSLVRLMGGEIEIIAKENGESGTCFRFNILLKCDFPSGSNTKEVDIEMGETSKPDNKNQNIRPTVSSFGPNLTIRTQNSIRSHLSPNPSASARNSPRLAFMSPSPRVEGSLVVLLIQNKERRRIAHNFLESNGVKVLVLNQWEDLIPTLRTIKMNLKNSIRGSSRKSDHLSPRDPPLLASDGTCSRSNTIKCAKNFLLLVIDVCAGPFTELYNSVAEFREDVDVGCYNVIWLDNPTSSNTNLFESGMRNPCDEIVMKPFHGSRLYEVLKMLPEFGGALPRSVSAKKHSSQRRMTPPDETSAPIKLSSAHENRPRMVSEIQEAGSSQSSEKLFTGKRFLLVDDTELTMAIALKQLQTLGATVEQCSNGKEALELVRQKLQDQRDHSTSSTSLPFDYILMDCEMPIMDGYEATREIRNVERDYGIRMPIIALTAHASDEGGKMVKAGMDSRLKKPLSEQKLNEAIHEYMKEEP